MTAGGNSVNRIGCLSPVHESSTHKSLAFGRLSYRTIVKLNVCNNRQSYQRLIVNPVYHYGLLFSVTVA